ncbi:ribosomal L7Ae/L30e/S12e/Gadd45 family protein [Tissierella pigra]|uniref:50S ribosomal protein L7ae-like protein n=1 Tax=Tissierella pigra TaxID=2607614 RepID=A0A6N7Y3L3_9FIRM|nr:ribosomal L7Ae/L30e/S12e/Gadd45 family protein [Tissierella pigra]MBU5425645.1 ribosomal L7Ae/L30e/S12e/Gadd45 family protein [Tissierella pigra]MSU03385.1 50S ribosomal protein L7ae-like protein [Tissierella pigra]
MLSKLNTDKKVVGAKQVKRALNSYEIEVVFIAKDAENKVTDEIKEICIVKHIELILVDNMKKLGDACGIDVSAATAALLK